MRLRWYFAIFETRESRDRHIEITHRFEAVARFFLRVLTMGSPLAQEDARRLAFEARLNFYAASLHIPQKHAFRLMQN